MYLIALKMLTGDKIKFITLVIGLTLSVLLITQQGSIFWGIMSRFFTTINNAQADIWVMDPTTEQVDAPSPMDNTVLPRVESVPGVAWAKPYRLGTGSARLRSGISRAIQLIGVDSDSLVGLPQNVVAGNIAELNTPDAVVVDKNELKKLGDPSVGDTFEINDQRAKVVAIINTNRNFLSLPLIYTTYDRAQSYTPVERKFLSYILVKPEPWISGPNLARRITKLTGLGAYTEDEFKSRTLAWYLKNTGIPINFGITVTLGVIVGAAIAAQTFYTFTLENLKHFATLKAMGLTNWMLTKMVLFQSFLVGLIGYGNGLGLMAWFGSTVPKKTVLAFNTHPLLLLIAFIAVVFVCSFSSLLSIQKIVRVEPATVFRG